jgi:hypothetical protein
MLPQILQGKGYKKPLPETEAIAPKIDAEIPWKKISL